LESSQQPAWVNTLGLQIDEKEEEQMPEWLSGLSEEKEGLFKEKIVVKDGYLDIPDKPGLGVELIEGLAEMYPYIPGWWNKPDPGMPK
jgi:L-alanine-DL-glutamate epimerase-like enolase superfamily enzyme